MVDQRAANYRMAANLNIACAECRYFIPGYSTDPSMCSVVGGIIRADYVCDGFQAIELDYSEGAPFALSADGVQITKVDESRQIVFGWAYVAETAKGERVVDHSGEFVDKGDLEDAAYIFNLNFREGDEVHTEEVKAHLIESFVVTDDKLAKMGLPAESLPRGWWTGWYIPEREVWDKVATGEYAMLSIGGTGLREAVSV